MESLESSKLRIKTGNTIKSLIRTMKVLATINMKKYTQLLDNAKNYDTIVKEGFANIISDISADELERLTVYKSEEKYSGYIIIGSDLGMCGQFNEKLIDFAESSILNKKYFIIAAGEKAVNIAEERSFILEKKVSLPKLASGDVQTISEILNSAFSWIFEKDVSSIFCIYNANSEKETGYTPSIFKIFPIDKEYIKTVKILSTQKKRTSFFRISQKDLLKGLVRNYLYIMIHKILCESIAVENSARLAAMKYAEKNIENYLEVITREYNETRQEEITSELLGIVGGYEVLSRNKKGRK